MACSSTPTQTLYVSLASTSTLTTFTTSVSTAPPLVTTITTQTCSETVLRPGVTSCVDEDVTIETTIAARQTTAQVPVIIVYEITEASPTKTLYASCSSTSDAASSSSSLAASTSSSFSASEAVITTVVTPAPSVIVTEVPSTLADGSIVLDTVTFTSTYGAVSVVVPVYPTTSSAISNISHSSNSKSLIAPIIGGVLGGFFGLIGLVFLLWYLWNRRCNPFLRSSSPELPSMSSNPMRIPGFIIDPHEPFFGVQSQGSSPPGSMRPLSSTTSYGPQSFAGTSSPGLSFAQGSSPTPPFFPSTTMLPGHSQPSLSRPSTGTRPSTPGHFFPQAPPSAYPRRQSRSGSASDDDHEPSSSEGHGSVAFASTTPLSRRSLTMEKGRPSSSRKSFNGTVVIDDAARPDVMRKSTDVTPQLEDLPRSPLFVVNHTGEPSSGSSTVGPG